MTKKYCGSRQKQGCHILITITGKTDVAWGKLIQPGSTFFPHYPPAGSALSIHSCAFPVELKVGELRGIRAAGAIQNQSCLAWGSSGLSSPKEHTWALAHGKYCWQICVSVSS